MSAGTSLELNVILEEAEQLCSFSLGRQKIRETEPSFDPLVIRRDHQLISEALEAVVRFGSMPFGGISDISPVLAGAAMQRVLTAPELYSVVRLIQGVKGIIAYEETIESEHPALKDLISTLTVHEKTEKKISSCISSYGEVLDDATPELRNIRRLLRGVDGEIAAAAAAFVARNSASVVDGIVTYRSGRAVVLVRASDKNSFGGMFYGDSASGQAAYIEPASLMAANNRKQEYMAREEEEVRRILAMCSAEVGAIASEASANLETCALLDALFAKAEWGKKHDAAAAVLTEKKWIWLKKARHPLIDPRKVVANTYRIEEGTDLLLITGPNTGGKTVSMKIIGLSVLLTYCGMPVPAEEAVIPFFDHVFVDIGDDQSVVSSLSSFSAHIEKLAEVMRKATSASLVLLDEIGSGTDPREGEALAIAALNELRKRKCMTVATTHYDRLKTYGKRHPDILLASVEFDMKELQPTYRYLEGMSGSSNAFEVALRCGLPKGIVRYARFLKEQTKTEEDRLLEQLEAEKSENRILNDRLLAKEAELAEKEEKLEKETIRLNEEKDRWRQKAEEEAAGVLEEARREADEILRQMRAMQADSRYHEVLAVRQTLNRQEKKIEVTSAEISDDREFAVGDVVELRSSDQVAKITAIRKKSITILLNGREMHVKKEQLRHSLKVIPDKKPEPFVTFAGVQAAASVGLECNLIGMRVDEASEKLAAYLDQAKMNRLFTFRIIHGDGTGALRKMVHSMLDKDRDIDSYRLGMPNEGGTGATVVTLKG